MMKTGLILIFILMLSCIVRKNPAQRKFIAYDQERMLRFNLMTAKVHNDHWNIAYRYGDDCPEEKRGTPKALEQAITTALQAWLQPLRALPTKKPIVSDFRYRINVERDSSDMRVTFHCVHGRSGARIHTRHTPDIIIRQNMVVYDVFMLSLVHEIGHAFGLVDTYVGRRENEPSTTTGGLNKTVGRQPFSIMSFKLVDISNKINGYLSEDDKRGIVWLYKHFHEELDLKDCFFPDYVLEKDPLGCRPKHPLIFEVKHGHPWFALKILYDDPSIDVNAQNVAGMTALHYAVMYEKIDVVKRLLEHKDINPSLRDKQGRTALDIAREASLTEIIALLQAVTPQQRAEDVNGDGMVNILDLVVVANNFGRKGKNIADVNGDGMVDIRDLVRIASAFGNDVASAPLHPEIAKSLPAAKLSQWLKAARQQASSEPAHRRGIQVLEQLLARATPPQTKLLPNYPNPFNPETWLPYQLAKPAKVTLSIHATDGRLVRKMELGNLPAGVYQSKSRAAHWDGRNTQGELVASGIYFYTLSAEDVTTTRKMLLRK